jgi:hypothetical protein
MTTPTRISVTRRRLLKFLLAAGVVAALAPLAGRAAELVAPAPPAPVAVLESPAAPESIVEPPAPPVPAENPFAYFEFTPSRRLTDDEWDYLQEHAERMAEAGRDGSHGGNALYPGDRALIFQTASPNPARIARIMATVTAGGVRLHRVGAQRAAGLRPRDLPPFDLELTPTPLNARAWRGVNGLEGKR